jgi:hypothetical protein
MYRIPCLGDAWFDLPVTANGDLRAPLLSKQLS